MAMTGKERALKHYHRKRMAEQKKLWGQVVDIILCDITSEDFTKETLLDKLATSGLRVLEEDPRATKRKLTGDYHNE